MTPNASIFTRRVAPMVLLAAATALGAPRAASAQQAEALAPLAPLAWLAGCWAGTLSSGALYEEWWMPDAGGMMLGVSRMSRDGRVLSFEFMRIAVDGGTPVYLAQPGGQGATAFRLASAADGQAVFENPEHDFPQRIRYGAPGSGAPFARIEGQRDGQPRGLDFPLERTACPGGR